VPNIPSLCVFITSVMPLVCVSLMLFNLSVARRVV